MQDFRWIGKRELVRTESPLYRFTKTDCKIGDQLSQDLEETAPYSNYSPYNFIQVTNQTSEQLNLYVGNRLVIIPTNTTRSFDSETIKAFRSFTLRNESSTDASGDIEVLIQKTLSNNELLRKIAGF